jgi:hypothetical protein
MQKNALVLVGATPPPTTGLEVHRRAASTGRDAVVEERCYKVLVSGHWDDDYGSI